MSVAKYIINLDEFAKAFSDLDLKLDGLEELKESLNDKLDQVLDLLNQILALCQNTERAFKSIDMSKHIPAIVNVFIISKVFEEDVLLTGITFSQTAWKVEDTISLEINGDIVLDKLHTKELGQQKYFNAFIPVKAGDEIRILYDNVSGNSKMFFCDLDYVKNT